VREAGVGGTGVREGGPGQRTVVGLAGLARGDDLGLPAELARVADAVRALGEAAAVDAGDVGSAGDGTGPQRSAGARDDEGRGDGPG